MGWECCKLQYLTSGPRPLPLFKGLEETGFPVRDKTFWKQLARPGLWQGADM